ncbi:hypothetical protein TIFTF001_026093 [Ficus carica]|uniref:Uncharacterized protein n=1 Tax=Ficus carica TaxID=3494 RepID=A0AA88DGZ6_FICCA|nr:hypothetical protein TIFTF001_026093 [Ficus carica]
MMSRELQRKFQFKKDPKNKTKRESAPLEALEDKLPLSGQGKRRKEESEKGLGSLLL